MLVSAPVTDWGTHPEVVRSCVTLMVRTNITEDMIARVCAMHPSVRCISRDEVLPTTGIEGAPPAESRGEVASLTG